MRIAFYCAHYPSESLTQLPLGLAYLGAYLEREGLASRAECGYAQTHQEALDFRPDVLCISSTSQVIDDACALAAAARQQLPKTRTVLGGYHVTALPHRLGAQFDVGVLGEGEATLAELCRALQSGAWSPADLRRIPGICFPGPDGRVETTPRRPPIADLDSLPLPHRHFPAGAQDGYMFTSRGCPYRCIYCASSVHWGHCRYHSPERVVREMEELHAAHGATRIYLLDDLFASDQGRLRAIAELLRRRGLLGRISFHGFVRSNLVDREMARLLAELNFHFVRFGAESGSQRVLDQLKKETVLVAQHQAAVDLCNQYGLPVGASFVFGTPGETERDLSRTFDFLARNRGRCQLAGFYLLTPYPGTELWQWAAERGLVSEDMDWRRLALDFTKPEFDWGRAVYLNADTIPLERFQGIVERFRAAFIHREDRGDLYAADRSEPAAAVAAPPPAPPGLRVEVGCGRAPTEGYVHCDVRALAHVEHRCNAWDLPFPPGSVAEIRSRHMLEHLSLTQVRAALSCWNVALAPRGRLDLCVPDLQYHFDQTSDPGLSPYLDASNYAHGMAGFYGWQSYAEDLHRWGFVFDELGALLEEHGFGEVRRLPDRRGMECNIQLTAVKVRALRPGALAGDPAADRRGWRVRWNDALLAVARLLAVPEPAGARGAAPILSDDPSYAGPFYAAARSAWRLARRIGSRLAGGPTGPAGGPVERQMVESVQEAEPGHLARYRLALRWIDPAATVLDAACGCGYGAAVLKDRAARVVAIDRSREAIAWAGRFFAHPGITYLACDLEDPAWTRQCGEGLFDAAVSLETLEHFRHPAVYLGLVAGRLRPGGVLILSTPNPQAEPLFVAGRCTNPFHCRHWSVPELQELLAGLGLELKTWFAQERTAFAERGDLSRAGFILAVAAKPEPAVGGAAR
jgi:anaerobic magnesium-protoporphyrin IX monomethyl ester cyclase